MKASAAERVAAAVIEAAERIRPYVRETYLERSLALGEESGAEVFCKLENLQHTGSFKVRGALNEVLALDEAARARGVVAASTGNHGAAVAWALRRVGASGLIFVPEGASPAKLAAIERLGGELRRVPGDPVEGEIAARRHAAEHGLAYVSPYNSWRIVGGQGTVGLELERQLEAIDAVFVALGGGGLISGIAGYLKSVRPELEVIGCSPEWSQVMIESVRAGRIVEAPSLPTLSDGTAGGVERDAITFELCRDLVDDYVTVTEEEIRSSLLAFLESERMLIEGAAAVAIAAFLKHRQRYRGKSVVLVMCGGNLGVETLRAVLA